MEESARTIEQMTAEIMELVKRVPELKHKVAKYEVMERDFKAANKRPK